MIIKKFQGKTEEEAISAAKKELGDAIVIMNVKQLKKKGAFSIFKAQMVEVTVALEEEPNPAENLRSAVAAVSEIAQSQLKKQEMAPPKYVEQPKETEKPADIEEKLETLQSMLEKQMEAHEQERESTPEPQEEQEETENAAFFKLLYNILLENEVNEVYANQLIDDLDKTMKPGMPIDFMLSSVYQKMILKFGQPSPIRPAAKGPKVIFFIGPTGVGKTTTIAKLASKFCVEGRKKIVLLTADTYRIAAAEQLRTYASILEAPFRIVYTPPEIKAAIQDFYSFDYILVDTAGHSHHNEELRRDMSGLVEAVDAQIEKEVFLVVSATTKYRDLVSIADSYQGSMDFKLIFTKLDETMTLGNLLNLKLHTGAPMSYVTCGQNVPDDIADFDPQETVKQLLGGGRLA